VGIVVWLLALVPSLADVLPEDLELTWADEYSDVPTLALVLATASLLASRARERRERGFWRLLAGCTVTWLAVRALYLFVPWTERGIAFDLATDVLYLAGYFLVALALETPPDQPPEVGSRGRERRIESLGTLVFGFGLLTYFVLVPAVFNPEIYASWVPSMLLYAVLDSYLLARTVTLLRGGLAQGWTAPVGWLGATFGLWLVGDLTEGFMYLETIPFIEPGTPWDLLWALPPLTLLVAARSRTWSGGPAQGDVCLKETAATEKPAGSTW